MRKREAELQRTGAPPDGAKQFQFEAQGYLKSFCGVIIADCYCTYCTAVGAGEANRLTSEEGVGGVGTFGEKIGK